MFTDWTAWSFVPWGRRPIEHGAGSYSDDVFTGSRTLSSGYQKQESGRQTTPLCRVELRSAEVRSRTVQSIGVEDHRSDAVARMETVSVRHEDEAVRLGDGIEEAVASTSDAFDV